MRISPTTTIDAIFGAQHCYSAVAEFIESQWVPERGMLDFTTGAQMSVVENIPYLCHAAVATERGLALLDYAGMPYAKKIQAYDTSEEYWANIHSLRQSGKKIILKHVYPEGAISDQHLWNPRALSCMLNNKRYLHRFVPEQNLPVRKNVSTHQVRGESFQLPFVLKAPVDWSTGSGSAVSICHTQKDIEKALQKFRGCDDLIIEEYLQIDRSYCVQFATMPDESTVYLGMAEEVTSAEGAFCGSWLEDGADNPPQLEEIGRSIMRTAVQLGYHGIAGFDMAICSDGRVLVLDLNFRPNGSTAAVLLYKSMANALGAQVMRYTSWKGLQGFDAFDGAVREAIERGWFLPLSVYDPKPTNSEGEHPMVSAVVAGKSREEVNGRICELERTGLITTSPLASSQ